MSICDTSVSLIYKDAAIALQVHDGAQEANGWAACLPHGRAELWCRSAIDGPKIILPNFQKKINYNPC